MLAAIMKLESTMILNTRTRIPGINLKLLFSTSIVASDHYKTLGNSQFRKEIVFPREDNNFRNISVCHRCRSGCRIF